MNDFDYWKIIKWIVIVLLAGFIGQFGKSFAKYFMAKGKGLKKAKGSDDAGQRVAQVPEDGQMDIPQALRENRALPDVDGEAAKAQKKSLKALVKLKKKEAKQLEKAGK
ncbi:MAG: hypothetical protein JXA79_02205 [Deltaproteobacteria bacterium]|nr:hypothetical protein [Deltaproteobacteria bacterium]